MSLFGKALRLLRGVKKCEHQPTAAILLAAGTGTRLASAEGTTKQLRMLNGKPLFLYSVLAFDASPCIDEIILVIRKEEASAICSAMQGVTLSKPFRLVTGGETRQVSARRGLLAVSEGIRFVAVHDAARCLITPEMIGKVAEEAYTHRAASAACRVTDTVKLVNADGFVEKTLDRDTLFRAQTPQIFEYQLYYAATFVALERQKTVTDDNMLLELVGQSVKMVDCGYENIKVTTKEDLLLAGAILEERAHEEN